MSHPSVSTPARPLILSMSPMPYLPWWVHDCLYPAAAAGTPDGDDPNADRTEPDDQMTRSKRRFGRSSRPTFAHGRPPTRTTSAVKSFSPCSSDEPTP